MTTLVLCPGLAGDAEMWRDQQGALAAWRPVVTTAHTRAASIDAMADTLLADHPDGPLVLCGTSMGGMLAMAVARRAPERVAGLALLGTTARPESAEMHALRSAAIVEFEAGRVRELIEGNFAFAFHPDRRADAPLVERYFQFVLDAGADQLIAQNLALMARPDARPGLAKVTCPTLVLCGDADEITPPDCAHEIASLVPHAELQFIDRCGHMLTMERPAAVNAALVRWLESIDV